MAGGCSFCDDKQRGIICLQAQRDVLLEAVMALRADPIAERALAAYFRAREPSPTDDLAAARERRDGTPISLASQIDAAGNVIVDVDLGTPPSSHKT